MARYSSPKTSDYAPAKKSLGQNFLVDSSIVDKIVECLGDLAGHQVIEIGPGQGALTRPLIEKGADLTVVELDDDLASRIASEYANEPNFRCLHTDVLDLDISTMSSKDAYIVGNLPYYISTPIIRRLIHYRTYFRQAVLMLQREVAERIAAEPGNGERGFMTVLVEHYFTVSKEFDVPPAAFRPRPKVWSSIVSLKPRIETINDDSMLETLVSASFRQKRKTILNNLKASDIDVETILSKAGIEARRRAETLTRDEWIRLCEAFEQEKRA